MMNLQVIGKNLYYKKKQNNNLKNPHLEDFPFKL